METRKLAAICVAFFNAVASAADSAAKEVEELIAEDGDGKEGGKERGGRDRGGERDDKNGDRGSRSSSRERSGGRDEKGGGKDKGDDYATEKEIVSATRAALKVLDEDDVLAIIKKHGDGAKKATEVEAEFRQDVIDALEEAMEDDKKD